MQMMSADDEQSVVGVQPHLAIDGRWVPYPTHNWYVGVAWHYTSIDGCFGIVTNHELWASSAAMLNDTGEMTYGLIKVHTAYEIWKSANAGSTPAHDLLRAAIDELDHRFQASPPFVLSASTSPALLNQWSNYGDGAGCCIGISRLRLLPVIGRTDTSLNEEFLPFWLRVLYDSEEQDAYIVGLFDQLVSPEGLIATAASLDDSAPNLLFQNLAMLVASLKHPAFAAENEVRYVVTLKSTDTISFRPSARGIIPFLRLGGTTIDSDGKSSISMDPLVKLPLPIQALMIGPPQGVSESRRLSSMRDFLSANGYAVSVSGAGIPYLP